MIVEIYRERFHARRWHSDFSPPMVEFKSKHLFVGDFILFQHFSLGHTLGKVERFFEKVYAENWCFILCFKHCFV